MRDSTWRVGRAIGRRVHSPVQPTMRSRPASDIGAKEGAALASTGAAARKSNNGSSGNDTPVPTLGQAGHFGLRAQDLCRDPVRRRSSPPVSGNTPARNRLPWVRRLQHCRRRNVSWVRSSRRMLVRTPYEPVPLSATPRCCAAFKTMEFIPLFQLHRCSQFYPVRRAIKLLKNCSFSCAILRGLTATKFREARGQHGETIWP